MAAAYSGHKRVCERLIARGVDVHQTDRRGETAMHSAAERGHVEVCELLHSKGLSATLASRVRAGTNRLKSRSCLLRVQPSSAPRSPLPSYVITARPFPPFPQLGTTPFHSAAERGHLPLCKWFVSIGVDAHTTDTFGRSPLHCAAERGQLAICQWLVDECNLSISSTTRVRAKAPRPASPANTQAPAARSPRGSSRASPPLNKRQPSRPRSSALRRSTARRRRGGSSCATGWCRKALRCTWQTWTGRPPSVRFSLSARGPPLALCGCAYPRPHVGGENRDSFACVNRSWDGSSLLRETCYASHALLTQLTPSRRRLRRDEGTPERHPVVRRRWRRRPRRVLEAHGRPSPPRRP